MKFVVLILLFPLYAFAKSTHLNDLLMSNYQSEFPRDGEYKIFLNVCSPKSCFNIVSVYYVTSTMKGMRRLAVFNSNNTLLGFYSGLDESPVKAVENILYFPKSEYGDKVEFILAQPPKTIWLDGQVYNFENVDSLQRQIAQ